MQYNWDINEKFLLPVGKIDSVEEFRITPITTWEKGDNCWVGRGIYHVTCRFFVNEVTVQPVEDDASILIDECDVFDGEGYFEYAIPLHIEVPYYTNPPIMTLALPQVKVENNCRIAFQVAACCEWDNTSARLFPFPHLQNNYSKKLLTEYRAETQS